MELDEAYLKATLAFDKFVRFLYLRWPSTDDLVSCDAPHFGFISHNKFH